MTEGCSSHETAVAAGALSQYLKAVIHSNMPSLTGPNYLLHDTWRAGDTVRRAEVVAAKKRSADTLQGDETLLIAFKE